MALTLPDVPVTYTGQISAGLTLTDISTGMIEAIIQFFTNHSTKWSVVDSDPGSPKEWCRVTPTAGAMAGRTQVLFGVETTSGPAGLLATPYDAVAGQLYAMLLPEGGAVGVTLSADPLGETVAMLSGGSTLENRASGWVKFAGFGNDPHAHISLLETDEFFWWFVSYPANAGTSTQVFANVAGAYCHGLDDTLGDLSVNASIRNGRIFGICGGQRSLTQGLLSDNSGFEFFIASASGTSDYRHWILDPITGTFIHGRPSSTPIMAGSPNGPGFFQSGAKQVSNNIEKLRMTRIAAPYGVLGVFRQLDVINYKPFAFQELLEAGVHKYWAISGSQKGLWQAVGLRDGRT